METHPIVVVIRALFSHLPRRHDNGDATAAGTRGHVVTTYAQRTDRMSPWPQTWSKFCGETKK